MSIIIALLVDAGAGLFWFALRWTIMLPLTLLIRYRKKKIMEGIEVTYATFTAIEDTYPSINIHLHIESRTTANLKVKSLTLCLRSGQWEFARICATPSLDNIPTIIKSREPTKTNLKFDAPLKWWLEDMVNMNINKAILEATSSWGQLSWPIKIGEGCSKDVEHIRGVSSRYLNRIRLKAKEDEL